MQMSDLFRTFYLFESLIRKGYSNYARYLLVRYADIFEQCSPPENYVTTYRLAAQALQYSHTQLAGDFLSLCKEDSRQTEAYRELEHLQKSLDSVRTGTCFFPLSVPYRKWQHGPHVLPNQNDKGQKVTQWYSGRVEDVYSLEITINAGLKIPNSEKFEMKRIILPSDKFDKWAINGQSKNLSEGDFVEIAVYAYDGRNPLIGIHAKKEVTFDFPPLRRNFN